MGESCFTSESQANRWTFLLVADSNGIWTPTVKLRDSAASDKAPCWICSPPCGTICYNRSSFSFQNSIQITLLVSQPVRLGTDTNFH
ncbi:unnamed protein product [Ixodes pacificus]